MNKKIKVIELLNLLAVNEIEKGTRIKYNGTIYIVDFPNLCGIYPEGGTTRAEDSLFAKLDICALDYYVEILEDEEEIDIKMFEQEWFEYYEGIISVVDVDLAVKMNEIVDKVNKLDKKINKEET